MIEQFPHSLEEVLRTRVQFVSESQIPSGSYQLFGTGGFSKRILDTVAGRTSVVIRSLLERPEILQRKQTKECFGKAVSTPDAAKGDIILGAGDPEPIHEQLESLLPYLLKINLIYVPLPDSLVRVLPCKQPKSRLLFVIHGLGVERIVPWTSRFYSFLAKHNVEVRFVSPLELQAFSEQDYQHVIIWNGQGGCFNYLRKAVSARGIQPTFIELGFFPQSEHIYLDSLGVNQECSLMRATLDWVGEEELCKLEIVRNKFLPDFQKKADEYVLIPLQVPTDSNVINCSRFQNGMQEFIDYVCGIYQNREKLVFKEHPKDVNSGTYDFHGHAVSTEPFTALLPRARLVHGITSSTLYEAALAGVSVISEGESLLNRHSNNVPALLAAMVDRQASVFETDYRYWVERYSHIRLE